MKSHDAFGNMKKVACFLKAFMPKIHAKSGKRPLFGCWMSYGTDKHINTWKFKIILSARKLKLDQKLDWSRLSSMKPFFSFLAKDNTYPCEYFIVLEINSFR